MTRLIIDDALRSKFERIDDEVVEICDTAGRTLGYYRPRFDKNEYEGVECPVSEEEIQRRIAEGGGRSLAEILADLERRG